jgi:hypothetical protein
VKFKLVGLLVSFACLACSDSEPRVAPFTGGSGGGATGGRGGGSGGAGTGGNVASTGGTTGSGGAGGGSAAAGGTGGTTNTSDAGADVGGSGDARETGQGERPATSDAQMAETGPRDVVSSGDVALPPPPPSDVCGYPSSRKVMVTDANTLRTALAAATAGDMIQFAAGSFVGKFKLLVSGTKAQPIVLCGPRTAIIDAGGGGYGLHLDGASFVIVSGISITNGLKNVMLDNAHDNLLSNLYVANSKQEGVHFRMGSSRNVIIASEIRDTGTTQAEFGEGLYIGSSGGSDEANDNKAVNNKFSNNGAECIDIKEGTRGGLIYGNTMDGGGLKGENFADSLIDVKGNNYLIEKNEGGNALLHAFEVHSISGAANSGHNNIFRDNTLSVKNPIGVGIWFDVKAMGNVVACSNKVTGGMGLSTATCTP